MSWYDQLDRITWNIPSHDAPAEWDYHELITYDRQRIAPTYADPDDADLKGHAKANVCYGTAKRRAESAERFLYELDYVRYLADLYIGQI